MIFEGIIRGGEILIAGIIIGVLDDLQVRYLRVYEYGVPAEIAYQAVFMAAATISAFFLLRNKSWSMLRNLMNLIIAVPLATVADNVSIDAGTLKPYLLLIPREGYVWREAVFGRVPALSQTAVWVNRQSITHGLINGYVLAIAMTASYIAIQYAWSRRGRSSSVRNP